MGKGERGRTVDGACDFPVCESAEGGIFVQKHKAETDVGGVFECVRGQFRGTRWKQFVEYTVGCR
jgi:hypothetical protein